MARIPHIIHYCWLGGSPMPRAAEECMASWQRQMPEWEYKRWTEASLTQALSPLKGREGCWLDHMPLYVKQAYEAKKYAFVSDYVRLWALERFGGLYMDVDFMVYRPFYELMDRYTAFAGYEGSKRQPVMMGVIASEPHGAWVRDMLGTYETREFRKADGSLDLTPNTSYFTDRLEAQGFVADGVEKDVFIKKPTPALPKRREKEDKIFYLHIFPVQYFCPVLTTGEDVRTEETYCEHMGESSWATNRSWKARVLKWFGPRWRTRAIKLKRKLLD